LPTPVEHLTIAERILKSPTLPEAMRFRLGHDNTVRGAFFFGHIAPDVQVVSLQPREVTHFFALPPTNRRPAYTEMLAAHPRLAQPSSLPPAQAAFLTGYLSHLLLDEYWVRDIFFPIFGPQQTWGERRERLLLHNVLRAWLDRRNLPYVRDHIENFLRQAEPKDWLPFATDADLSRWRDLVADQFEPGAEIRTIEIFANRARIPDTEFLALLEPGVMEERIFSQIALTELDRFYERALVYTLDLTVRYLDGCTVSETV
jgi:hypothetical protein